MRKYITIIASISSIAVAAQVINGSFEDGLNGWQAHYFPAPDTLSLSNEVPFGGGLHSLVVPINGYDVAIENQVVQPLGLLAPGTAVVFGGWMRSTVAGPIFDVEPSIALCTCDSQGFTTPVGTELFYIGPQYSWTLHQTTFTTVDAPPEGHMHCLKLGSGIVYQNLGFNVWFDEVFLNVDLSTIASEPGRPSIPRSHPNPATDKLWIDLPEAPLSIAAIDGTGRSIPLRTFHHNGRTVEVDVSSVPPGLCVMQVNLISGMRTIRFIKA